MRFLNQTPLIIMIGLLFVALESPAGGSRVGNGNDNNKGKRTLFLDKSFEVQTPAPFSQIKEYADGIKIEGPPLLKVKPGPMGMMPSFQNQNIKLMSLKEQRPEMTALSKEDLIKYLQDRKWSPVGIDSDCVVAQKIKNNTYTTVIVTWGNEEGYMIAADKTEAATKATMEIVKSTKIYSGCQWK